MSNLIKMNYGKIIDGFDDVSIDEIYRYFYEYFGDPVMTKHKDVENYSMYICKMYCLLNRTCKYVICMVEKNKLITGDTRPMSSLFWDILQTRVLDDNINVKSHEYYPEAKGPLLARINKIESVEGFCRYKCELPIEIVLLHTEKNDGDVYQMTGSVVSALETYNTIVTFK